MIRRAKHCRVGGALAFAAVLLVFTSAGHSQVITSKEGDRRSGVAGAINQEADQVTLSPNAALVARIIGVQPLIAKLSSVIATIDTRAIPGVSVEEWSVREQVTESVAAASLDVDSVLGEIDFELGQMIELQGTLLARRQRAVGTTTLATLALSTGLGAVSGVLQFSKTTQSAGNAVGFAAGGISTLLSLRSFRQHRTGSRADTILSNMLAPFFWEVQDQPGAYGGDVWAYLDSPPGGDISQATRRQRLLAVWLRDGRYPPLDNPQSKLKIALLTSTNAANRKLETGLLAERTAMLNDVRKEVSSMKRDLRDLIREIRVVR